MSDFDARWQRLVESARSVGPVERALDPRQVERLAGLALAAAVRQRETALPWRRLALAAGVFVTSLAGLGMAAAALGLAPELELTVVELANLPRRVPSAAFVPTPPDVHLFGVPELAGASPAPWFHALDRLLTHATDAEILP